MTRARYLVVSPTLDSPQLGSVNELNPSTLAPSHQKAMPKVTTTTPIVSSSITSTSITSSFNNKDRGSYSRGNTSDSNNNKRVKSISGSSGSKVTVKLTAPTLGDNPIEQHISLDKILKSKLVSDAMSISDSVDDNLLDIYNTPMHFGTKNSSEITVQAGAVAHLPCTVHQLGEGVVSISQTFFKLLMFLYTSLKYGEHYLIELPRYVHRTQGTLLLTIGTWLLISFIFALEYQNLTSNSPYLRTNPCELW